MKNVYFFACFLAALVLGACGSGDSPAYDDSLSPANATKPVTPVTITDTLLSDTTSTKAAINNTSLNASPGVTPGQVVASSPKPVASKGTSGLNPAHGEPGHRCDIGVGAPLNSPPVKATSQQPVVSAPQIQSQPIQAAPVQKAQSAGNGSVKLNPPHGQPGHDCAVKVGDPLKN